MHTRKATRRRGEIDFPGAVLSQEPHGFDVFAFQVGDRGDLLIGDLAQNLQVGFLADTALLKDHINGQGLGDLLHRQDQVFHDGLGGCRHIFEHHRGIARPAQGVVHRHEDFRRGRVDTRTASGHQEGHADQGECLHWDGGLCGACGTSV